MLATRLRWVSMAPLDTPVVPPVYCRKAISCGWMLTAGRVCLAPSFSVCLKGIAPGSSKCGTCCFTYFSTKSIR